MNERPPWVPDHVSDAEITWYADTLAGYKTRLEYEAKQIGAHDVLAGLDQLEAAERERRERLLREQGLLPRLQMHHPCSALCCAWPRLMWFLAEATGIPKLLNWIAERKTR